KDLPYELVPVSLAAGEHRAPTHLARNPIGQVPVLEMTSGGEAVVIAQSVAILEYLEEIHPEPALLPAGALARARVRELVELVNAGIQPLQNSTVLKHVASLGGDSGEWARHYILKGLLAFEERTRGTRGRFSFGDSPTLADVFLVPQMFNARSLDLDMRALGPLVEIDARCQELPRWARAHPSRQPDA